MLGRVHVVEDSRTGRRCRRARCPCWRRSSAARISSCIRPAGSRAASRWATRSSSWTPISARPCMSGCAACPLDDDALALDAFREVGPGKHFFGAAHTLANYETAFWESAVADNNSFEQWRDEGMKDAPSARLRALQASPRRVRAAEARPGDGRGARRLRKPPAKAESGSGTNGN